MILRNLEKHQKYGASYKPNDLYWGLGVEHETYLETNKLKQVTVKELKENIAAERYCVSYYTVYNTESFAAAIDGLFDNDTKILIPILANSHTFQQTDLEGEHQTTYERIPKPNKKFNGKTVFEWMKEKNPKFNEEYCKSFIFDGDTIEFMTQKFYKTTVTNVMSELMQVEHNFITELNTLPKEGIFKTYGPFQIAQQNYPFATYLTNLKNNAMFNNGTYHINITLPTQLNAKGEIADFANFTKQHQSYAKAFQWISPLLVAKYGSPDPLCESKQNGEKYSAGSQRLSVSRYIGLGTYDTDKMPIGKILTEKRDKLAHAKWYESFHKKADYKFLNDLGLDINFNKHYSHGLEFRIFDSVPYSDLKEIIETLIYLADFSLENELCNPVKTDLWNKIAENCVHNGRGYYMDVPDQNELFEIFKFSYLSKEPLSASMVLDLIVQFLKHEYAAGPCVKYMILGEEICSSSIYDEPKMDIRPVEPTVKLETKNEEQKLEESNKKDSKKHQENKKKEDKLKSKSEKPEKIDKQDKKDKHDKKEVMVVDKKSSWCCC